MSGGYEAKWGRFDPAAYTGPSRNPQQTSRLEPGRRRDLVDAAGSHAQHELGAHSRGTVGYARFGMDLVITSVSHAWRIARADGGQSLHQTQARSVVVEHSA